MLAAGVHVHLLLLLLGAMVLLTLCGNARRSAARTAISLLAFAAAAVYWDWRLGHTGLGRPVAGAEDDALAHAWVWGFLVIELLCTFELGVFLLQMSRYRDNLPDADRYERALRARDPDDLPEVDVWIATYDESWQILEKTIIGALNLDYPRDKLRIWVLDDKRRDWLAERCAALGVRHVTRPDNEGKKAGNHNNALALTTAPFILSLDADFVPFPSFLYRTLGFFADPKVAIVQTPQTYYNPDAVRCSLGMHGVAPDELALFYREQQPARDAWDAAFYCGSCAVLRRSAIEAIGGFVTETDVEDQPTAVKLLAHGYCTRYLNEPLSAGLAAESVAVLHDQRNRWCRGSLQIVFMPFGPFGRGLKLIHRLLFCESHWVTMSVCPIVFALAPLMFWGPGYRVYPAADGIEILGVPFGLLIAVGVALSWLSERKWVPLYSAALELFMAIELAPTALGSLLKPFGKPLVSIMPVTPKGSAAGGARVDRRTFGVLIALIAATLASVAWSFATQRPIIRDALELTAFLGWTAYSVSVMTVAALMCFERPYKRAEERFAVAQPALLQAGPRSLLVTIRDISLSGARLSIDAAELPARGEPLALHIPSIGIVPASVVVRHERTRALGIKFGELPDEIRHRLVRALFTNPALQEQPAPRSLWPVVAGLIRRFARSA